MIIKYLGHSAFEFQTDIGNILVDPFITQNPEYNPANIINIFVTHGHGDHLGSAVELSKEFNAPVTAVFELANYCEEQGATTQSVSIGGKLSYPWGWASFTPAFHSSSTPDGKYAGCAAGIVFKIDNTVIFHAGDTGLNSEMKVIREFYSPDIAILPIGGTYTMDIDQAIIAARWIGAKNVIPMHYNTFPAVYADANKFKELNTNTNTIILNKNECVTF